MPLAFLKVLLMTSLVASTSKYPFGLVAKGISEQTPVKTVNLSGDEDNSHNAVQGCYIEGAGCWRA